MSILSTVLAIMLAQSPGPAVTGANAASGGGGTTNHARSFNGSSDSLQSAATLSSLNTLTTVSASFWMYWNVFANDDKLAFESSANFNLVSGAFIVNPDSSGGGGVPAGFFEYSVSNGSSILNCIFTRPSAGAWHQYVLVWNFSAPSCGAYVDGVVPSGLTASTTATGTFSSQTLNVMSRNNASLWGAGLMSEIAFYSGIVNSTDATSLSNCSRPTTVTSATLLYYWPINQTSPEVATTGGVNLNVTGTTNTASSCSF